MKFTTALVTLTALFSVAEACKCGGNIDATRACCRDAGGDPTDDDCPANQISERLSRFASCCKDLGSRSDCRCPVGCLLSEVNPVRLAQGLEPLGEKEAQAIVDGYEA